MPEILSFPALFAPSAQDSVPDREQRVQALDIRRSWIVEAPAGSGKTGLLIQRYLKLLTEASLEQPEQVLAITFTLKATAEMRERVLDQLEAAAAATPIAATEFDQQTRHLARAVLTRDAAASWGLIEHPHRLNIRTIDSVCAEIARSLPVLSRSGGRQQPVRESARLFSEAARRTFLRLGGVDRDLDRALTTLLLHRDGSLQECERLLADMLATRDQWGRLIPLDAEHLEDATLDATVLPKLERTLDHAICQALTELGRSIPAGLLHDLTALAAELAHLDGYNGEVSPMAFCAGRKEAPTARAEHLAHWRALVHLLVAPSTESWRRAYAVNHMGFKPSTLHKARLTALTERIQHDDDLLEAMCRLTKLPPAAYPREQWVVAKALFRILRHALAELQIVFAERGECDFAELGLAARAALGEDSGAADLTAALGLETRHLLVDEMQDTSTSQYELIERLTHGWDGQSQTIFLVGDPKQSIYRFRQARVERFVRTLHDRRLGGLSLGVLRLSANFRSQRRLVEQVNAGFSDIFPAAIDPAHPEQVPFVHTSPVRAVGQADGVVWHTHLLPSGFSEAAMRARRQQARSNARATRELAAEWLARPHPAERPWRVAVLVRAREHLGSIVAEFKKNRGDGPLPFRAVEIERLGEQQEVLDLVALTRALLHPADRVAWLAILRAPWCGLGLADLHQLAGADDPAFSRICVQDLLHTRGHLLSQDGEQRLARVWPVLEAAMLQHGRLPIAQHVERTWRSLGGDAPLSAGALANAMRLLALLDELEAAGGRINLTVLEQRLKRLYAEPAVHTGAVDLMTIHGAKGLEWDVVILPALEKKAAADRYRLLSWLEIDSGDDDAAHIMLAPIAGRGEDSKELNNWILSVHALREAAERKRLLYVACTRAREELHLFASPNRKSNGTGVAVDPSSLLKAAWPMAEAHFDPRGQIVEFALPAPEADSDFQEPEQDVYLGDLAAGAQIAFDFEEPARPPVFLARLPLAFNPTERFTRAAPLAYGRKDAAPGFARPEGSFAARCFGNAMHAFLELAAKHIAQGQPAQDLSAGWLARATALLRADGLAPATVDRLAHRIVADLARTLADAQGLWVLAPHPLAASEFALAEADRRRSLRLDRIFRAGAEPMLPGSDFLWIVDYKTATHGAPDLDAFLAAEREAYQPQLEEYARSVAASPAGDATLKGVRVALYYPALARLVWWIPESNSGSA